MAEARLGVDPRPAISRVGFEVDTSVKKPQLNLSQAGLVLFIPHPKFILRSIRKLIRRSVRRVQTAFLPLPTWMVLTTLSGVTAWVVNSPGNTWQRSGRLANILWTIDEKSPIRLIVEKIVGPLSTRARVGYLTVYFSGCCMIGITLFQRYLLRQLLAYHGWLYERKGRSLKTKVWGFVLRYVYIRRMAKNLYAYQGCLPTLPLPDLNATVNKWHETMKPLLDEKEAEEAKALSTAFLKEEGTKLQKFLRLKWWISPNYISDWWLNLVYLRSRDPLPINSNWYGVMPGFWQPTKSQAARAASMAYQLTKINYYIENETFEPQSLNGMIPLCMQQYEMAFGVTRVPGAEQDVLVKAESSESRHLAVVYKGRFYKVDCYSPHSNNPLTALQLYAAFEGILNSKDETDPKELYLPALTAINRTEWAKLREQYFLQDPYNRSRLELIEKALFVVCLDDDPAAPDLTTEARRFLMGNGHSRWCDKSFNLIVTSDAKAGVHAEHAWADAPTLAHLIEICSGREENVYYYNPDGSIRPTEDDIAKQKKGKWHVYPAERIRFQVSEELEAAARAADADYRKRIEEIDFSTKHLAQWGKGAIKKHAKMSPDGFIQMALQVAYYRDRGHFDQTYESSMTRLFYGGRTETIRSASVESAEFVKAFLDPAVPPKTKVELLRKATERHQMYSHDAMTGKAVDRHLFGLYVVSRGKQIDSPFLRFALGRKWKLSTSQVPTKQCGEDYHHPDKIRWLSPNGGFGPVADDGYGVSYCVCGEDDLFFNVSGKKGYDTNCDRFGTAILQALNDMMDLCKAAVHTHPHHAEKVASHTGTPKETPKTNAP